MKVTITVEASRQFQALPASIQQRVADVLGRLQDWPTVSGVKPLRGDLAGRYRVRTGDYRVQFSVKPDRVVVEKVGHRDGFYDE